MDRRRFLGTLLAAAVAAPLVASAQPATDADQSPDQLREVFESLDAYHTDLLDASAESEIPLVPTTVSKLLEYRRGLVRRYLRIDGLYRANAVLEFPGPPHPTRGYRRTISAADLYVIANLYLGWLQEPLPQSHGEWASRLTWNDADGRRIYFATSREDSGLATALTYTSIAEARRRLSVYMSSTLEAGTIRALVFVPGGTISESMYVLITGRRVTGEAATTVDRIFAVTSLALQGLPIAVGVVRTSGRLATPARDPLFRHLTQQNELASRLRMTPSGVARVKWQEIVMTQYMDDYYKWLGVNARTMQYGQTLSHGLDMRVIATARGTVLVDELKQSSRFSGDWSRFQPEPKAINIPQIDPRVTSQGSNAYILDRAIKTYNWAQQNKSPQLASEARELISRFARGEVRRRVIVMNDEGAVFVANQRVIQQFLPDDMPVADLRAAATNWLGKLPPPPPPTNVHVR